jgi:hypothetical protein
MHGMSERPTCSLFQLLCEMGVVPVSGHNVLLEMFFIPSVNCILSITALLLWISSEAMHK